MLHRSGVLRRGAPRTHDRAARCGGDRTVPGRGAPRPRLRSATRISSRPATRPTTGSSARSTTTGTRRRDGTCGSFPIRANGDLPARAGGAYRRSCAPRPAARSTLRRRSSTTGWCGRSTGTSGRATTGSSTGCGKKRRGASSIISSPPTSARCIRRTPWRQEANDPHGPCRAGARSTVACRRGRDQLSLRS